MSIIVPNRRLFLKQATWSAAGLSLLPYFNEPGRLAEELETPSMTEGPFYPNRLPLDTDNDLLILNDKLTPAVGKITHMTGKITDPKGKPIRNAVVEIWQTDNNGIYLHKDGGDRKKLDKNFQGFGRFTTDLRGEYYFRTIQPTAYPGRTPHIHVAINVAGKRKLSTQVFIKGHPQNDRDGLIRGIPDPKKRQLLMAEYKPLKGSKIGELTANFDIVIGGTPDDREPRVQKPSTKPEKQ